MNLLNSNPGFQISLDDMIAYLDNNLDEEKRTHIEKLTKENPLYQEAINTLREIRAEQPDSEDQLKTIEHVFNQSVHHIASEIQHQSVPAQEEVSRKQRTSAGQKWSKWLPHQWGLGEILIPSNNMAFQYSLGVLTLLIMSYLVFLWVRPPFESRLSRAYLSHYEDPVGGTLGSVEDMALKHYNSRNYQDAIPLLKQLLSSPLEESLSLRYNMYLGVSLLFNQQAEASVPHFKVLINHGNNLFINSAQWYLALAYLERVDRASAIPLLTELADSPKMDAKSREYARKAREILNQLE